MSDALEKKWDVVWRAACLVAATIDRYDETANEMLREFALKNLVENCRALRAVVESISPTPSDDPRKLLQRAVTIIEAEAEGYEGFLTEARSVAFGDSPSSSGLPNTGESHRE